MFRIVPKSTFSPGGTGQNLFPTVSGSNLLREEMEFPRDFGKDINLVFVPFLQRQQYDVNSWLPFTGELELKYPQLTHYEFPTIDDYSAIARTFINEGMRAGIADPDTRYRTVTLYIDLRGFMKTLGIPDNSEIHVFLVSKSGEILWRCAGSFTRDKGDELMDFIASLKS